MYITRFGEYDLPAQLEMEESHGAARRGNTATLAGLGGGWDNNGLGPDPLAEDIITKSFIIEADSGTDLQTAVDNFVGAMMLNQSDWQLGLRLLQVTLPDGSKRNTWAKCEEVRARWEYFNVNEGWVPVQVVWRRAWPVWEKDGDLMYAGYLPMTLAEIAAAGYSAGSVNVVEQAVSASPTTFSVTNSGTARVTVGLIEFDGVIVNPKVENLTNDYWFQWAGSLGAGDRFVLYTDRFDSKVNGAAGGWDNITVGTDGGQLLPMVLEPGVNSLRVTGTSPSCTFRYYFAKLRVTGTSPSCTFRYYFANSYA